MLYFNCFMVYTCFKLFVVLPEIDQLVHHGIEAGALLEQGNRRTTCLTRPQSLSLSKKKHEVCLCVIAY